MTATFPRTMGYGLGASLQRGASAFGPWVDPYDYPQRDQTMTTAPSFPPFKFEPRRARIDWRLLHGIDINAMMRDVDLDTLEKIVNIVAFGDIEAEDTRHLTELNFIKIFRLSQMMIEYLLYVQDCLQSSNAWLQQDRSNMDKYVQAARLRIRELEANLKMNKRELRRTRKTIKTYELLAVLNDGKGGTHAATMPGGTATSAFTATVTTAQPASPGPPPPQVARPEPNPVNLAMEALLRKELAVLGERLGKATLECQTLRSERDDLFQAVKDLETTVKARSHLSGMSSPLAYSRQNAEAMQTIQGLQEQLNRATVEIAKLRHENEEMSEGLEQANAERRQLQDEKSRLLSELATRPAESPRGGADSPYAGDNLGSMLLEADRQKAALQDQLSDAKAEIAALQKQLMKAMKATALGAMPPSQAPPDERALRELETARVQLERELADVRRTYNENVQQLQGELAAAQARAAEADHRLSEMRAAQQDGSSHMSPPRPTGGFVTIVEERRGGDTDDLDHGGDRQRAILAEYEATNERLNQQLIQIKGERNQLAGEVEQLRLQLQNRTSPPPGDRSIGRDWRTEEIDRLKDERDAAQRRIQDLEDALRDRDGLIERLRDTIRELQAQLDEYHRQQQPRAEAESSRVRQQVEHFNRLADPTRVQGSFSFTGDSAHAVVETPTSVRTPALPGAEPPQPGAPESPPRPASLQVTATPPIPEEPERTSAAFQPPSPQRPGQAHDPSQETRWLRRIQRPTQAEALAIQGNLTRHVAGTPEALDMKIQDEIRVITEHPYEYASDDEARFQAMMPYEMAERKGVRSVRPHVLEDLATARALYTNQLLAVLDDELTQYGVDPTGSSLSDKAYLACMQELSERRSRLWQRYPKELQERAEDLRNFLLTHIELIKRGAEQRKNQVQQAQVQELLQQVQQQRTRQQQQQVQPSAAGGDGHLHEESDLEPDLVAPAGTGASSPSAATGASGAGAVQQQQLDDTMPAAVLSAAVSLAPNPSGLAAAAAAAANPLSTAGGEAAGAGTQAQRQLPAFPSRQPSLERSRGAAGGASVEEPRGVVPGGPTGSRPASGSTQQLAASQRVSTPGQGRGTGAGSTHLSRQASGRDELGGSSASGGAGGGGRDDPAERTSSAAVTNLQPMRGSSSSSSSSSGGSGVGPRQQSMRSGRSLPRSGTTSTAGGRPQAAARVSSPEAPPAATPVMLTREVTPSGPERVTLGHARPTPGARPGARPASGAAAVVATTPGGNMNMSIRSVQYQDSDFDDDDDEAVQLPRPRPVRRVADEDEYTLTEDEAAQQDMGIEDSDDFRPEARPPRILMNPGGSPSRPTVPSRLGTQTTPASAQSRGWATDEPLQQAPARPRPADESAEVEMLDSIQSFDNPNSQPLQRSPGAWGSPSGTMRNPPAHGGREPSTQMSVASRHTGWNEAITSFGVASGAGDEVQAIQDITESFTESIRPMGRMMGQRPAAGASQATAPQQPRIIPRRNSFDSDLSDIEYV